MSIKTSTVFLYLNQEDINYLGKLYDSQIAKNKVRIKEVKEPKNKPHPDTFIFDSFEHITLKNKPTTRNNRLIKSIKLKLSKSFKYNNNKKCITIVNKKKTIFTIQIFKSVVNKNFKPQTWKTFNSKLNTKTIHE